MIQEAFTFERITVVIYWKKNLKSLKFNFKDFTDRAHFITKKKKKLIIFQETEFTNQNNVLSIYTQKNPITSTIKRDVWPFLETKMSF